MDDKELIPVWSVTLTLGDTDVEVLTTTEQVKSMYGGDYYEDIEPVGYLVQLSKEDVHE